MWHELSIKLCLAPPFPRVVKPPRHRTGHIICDLCLRYGSYIILSNGISVVIDI